QEGGPECGDDRDLQPQVGIQEQHQDAGDQRQHHEQHHQYAWPAVLPVRLPGTARSGFLAPVLPIAHAGHLTCCRCYSPATPPSSGGVRQFCSSHLPATAASAPPSIPTIAPGVSSCATTRWPALKTRNRTIPP